MESTLKKSIRHFWGIGDMGTVFISIVFNMYFAYFLTDIAGLPLSYTSFILIFVSVADIVISLVSGVFLDSIKAMRWGRYRTWLAIAPLCVLLVSPFLFFKTEDYLLNTVIIISAFLLYIISVNLTVLSNYTLIPIMAKNKEDQTILTSNRMTGTYMGTLIFGSLAPFLLTNYLTAYFGQWAYMFIAAIAAMVFVITFRVHFNLSKGAESTFQTKKEKSGLKIRQILSALFKTPSLIPAIIADMSSTFCAFVLPAIAVYYYSNVVEQPGLLAIHLLVIGVGSVVGSYCSRFMLRRFDVKTACLLIYPIISIALFSTQFVAYMPRLFIAISGVIRFFAGMAQPIEFNFYLDSIVYSQWKTGIDAKGAIMGISGVAFTLSNLIKSILISATFAIVGYQAGSTSEAVKAGIITAYSVIPAIIPLVGWVVLFLFYKLTPDKLEMMQKEIEERKNNINTWNH
ncbi:MAG: MFS transporter [Candidatus Symbiothrix sp.]|jgi:GPH family glycoside/pentoside/hexuronide:cation symporter|nr:MFS transporter [Candidatus Symbiothrix sp.]